MSSPWWSRRVGAPAVPGDGSVASGDDRTAPGKEEASFLWMQKRRVLTIRGFANIVQSGAGGWVQLGVMGMCEGLDMCPLCEGWLWALMGKCCVCFSSAGFRRWQKEKWDRSWTSRLMVLVRNVFWSGLQRERGDRHFINTYFRHEREFLGLFPQADLVFQITRNRRDFVIWAAVMWIISAQHVCKSDISSVTAVLTIPKGASKLCKPILRVWWILPVAVTAVGTGVGDSAESSHQLTYLGLCREEDMPLLLPICTEEERQRFPMTAALVQTSWCDSASWVTRQQQPAAAVSKDFTDSKNTKLHKYVDLQAADQYHWWPVSLLRFVIFKTCLPSFFSVWRRVQEVLSVLLQFLLAVHRGWSGS